MIDSEAMIEEFQNMSTYKRNFVRFLSWIPVSVTVYIRLFDDLQPETIKPMRKSKRACAYGRLTSMITSPEQKESPAREREEDFYKTEPTRHFLFPNFEEFEGHTWISPIKKLSGGDGATLSSSKFSGPRSLTKGPESTEGSIMESSLNKNLTLLAPKHMPHALNIIR